MPAITTYDIRPAARAVAVPAEVRSALEALAGAILCGPPQVIGYGTADADLRQAGFEHGWHAKAGRVWDAADDLCRVIEGMDLAEFVERIERSDAQRRGA